jgi:hypothetical protein
MIMRPSLRMAQSCTDAETMGGAAAATQLGAYTVLLIVLLVWVAAIGVVALRRAA